MDRDPLQQPEPSDVPSRRFYDQLWPHAPHVLRVALILTGNDADAEDLAQDTLLKAFRAIDQFRPGTDARRWLTTILRNARIDRVRATRSSDRDVSLDRLEVEPAADGAPAVEDEAIAAWERPQEILEGFSDRQIIAALQLLPEEIRWTLLLVDVEQLDHAAAAAVLDVPVGTIKSRAHRGRAMLRAALAAKERDNHE